MRANLDARSNARTLASKLYEGGQRINAPPIGACDEFFDGVPNWLDRVNTTFFRNFDSQFEG
jgi:hypothetical protein